MSAECLPVPDPADPRAVGPEPVDPSTGPTRVVYFAMKPQLRGRFRRNVSTLLELGADVTVLTALTNKDFFLGLYHPRLHAEFFEARSFYVRLSLYTSRRSREQIERRRARAALRAQGMRPVRRALMIPVYLLAAGAVGVRRLVAPLADILGRLWRRLPGPVRRRAWATARWRILTGRRLRRWWRRNARPAGADLHDRLWAPLRRAARSGLRRDPASADRLRSGRRAHLARVVARRRLILGRAVLNRRLTVNRALVRHAKDVLRPWHRMDRFFAFWRESAARGLELRPDFVVSSDLPGLVGASRVAERLGVGHLHDCHELYLESTAFRPVERRVLAPIECRHLRRACRVVAVNRSIAAEYRLRYGREPVVVRNCAPRLTDDLQISDLREMAGLPAHCRVVLYQGGFSIGRGLDVCVAAVPRLPADTHLVLLGFGPLGDDLLRLADWLGVRDRVHVVDAVPPEQLAACTASATVGLMPYQPVSLNNLLALPNKVFEYTAVGVPIVVSDFPELRRVAIDEGCGETYDPFDAASLAEALLKVLDPSVHEEYRRSARQYGRVNVWENERQILIAEMKRACPRLSPPIGGEVGPT